MKHEHLVRHCPAPANGLPWFYLDKAKSFRRKRLLSLLSFPGQEVPTSPGCAHGEGPRAAQVSAVVVCAAGRHLRDQHLVSRCFRIYKHIP